MPYGVHHYKLCSVSAQGLFFNPERLVLSRCIRLGKCPAQAKADSIQALSCIVLRCRQAWTQERRCRSTGHWCSCIGLLQEQSFCSSRSVCKCLSRASRTLPGGSEGLILIYKYNCIQLELIWGCSLKHWG